MTITSAGRVGIATSSPTALFQVNGSALATAWNTSSDMRLKENIHEIENPLDKILRLRGVEFDWRSDVSQPTSHEQTHDIGVIAQNVEKVFPEAVTSPQGQYKSVAYSKLIAPLIGAVKALYAKWLQTDEAQKDQAREIASLKAKSGAQEEKIEKLEQDNAALKSYLCAKDPQAAICK
jgi:hypothetical protein